MEQQKADIYERITQQIIEAIEEGAGEFRMPWHVTECRLLLAGERGERAALPRGQRPLPLGGRDATRLRIRAVGEPTTSGRNSAPRSARGEKAAPVVFWKITDKAGREFEEDDIRRMPANDRLFLAQGLQRLQRRPGRRLHAAPGPASRSRARIAEAESFLRASSAAGPARRRLRLLHPRPRRDLHAPVRGLPRPGRLLLDVRPRGDPLDRLPPTGSTAS